MVQNFIFLIVLVHDLRKVKGGLSDSDDRERILALTSISIIKMIDFRVKEFFIWLG
jgi:hypothetical protein